jgi:hypothetical protein
MMMARDLDPSYYEAIAVVLPRAGVVLRAGSKELGTALVAPGEPREGSQLLYYQAPIQISPGNFADRVMIAHGRAWHDRAGELAPWRPSTHRVIHVESSRIVTIGRYDPREGQVTLDPDDAALRRQLSAWLRLDSAPDPEEALRAELQTGASVKHQTRRDLRRMITAGHRHDPGLRQWARRRGHGDLFGDDIDPA